MGGLPWSKRKETLLSSVICYSVYPATKIALNKCTTLYRVNLAQPDPLPNATRMKGSGTLHTTCAS